MQPVDPQEFANTSLAARPALNQNQAEFLRAYASQPFAPLGKLCKQVGVKRSSLRYWEKNSAEFRRAIAIEHARSQQVINMSRKRVLHGLLEAIDLAKDQRQPTGMIAGWKEIGRMCGFYEPERREVKLSVDSQQLVQELQTLGEVAVLDATAHHLKFAGFQEMYFEDRFPPEFEVKPRPEFQNRPQLLTPRTDDAGAKTMDLAGQIAALLGLSPKRQ